MKAVEPHIFPGEALVVFAKDQPQYKPLPAAVNHEGVVVTEWEMVAEELAALMQGGRIRLTIHTFGHPLQPVCLEVVAPDAPDAGA